MTEEEKAKAVQEVIDDFLQETDHIKSEYAEKIKAILAEINEAKIKDLKTQLGI